MLNNYFYFYFLLIVLCSLFIITARNPIQSVFFLILVFAFSSVLFIILGAEFLAVLVIIIYVGAISILFLFVVMMLNLRIMELYSTFYNYLPIGSFIGLFFFFEFFYAIYIDIGFLKFNPFMDSVFFFLPESLFYKGNASFIGWILYNFFNHYVLLSSMILLVSMIGSIVLTVDFEYRPTKRKDSYTVVKRNVTTVSYWQSKN